MTTNVQPPGNSQQSSSVRVADRQAQVQARTDVGLGPPRETAPQSYMRPPDASSGPAQWLLFICVAILGLAVVLLLLASLASPNSTLASIFGTRVEVATGVVPAANGTASAVTPVQPDYLVLMPGYQLWISDDFAAPSQITAAPAEGQVATSLLADSGVFRMQVMPNQLGWTLFDLAQTTSYHLETSAVITSAPAGGAAGVIARFAGAGNFYLLSVDDAGAVNVQLWLQGTPYTVQSTPAVSRGLGQPNRLAAADDGNRLRFYVNQFLVAEVLEPQLPFGRPGIAAVAPGDAEAVVDFDWIAIYRPEP